MYVSRPLVACRQPWKPYWEQEIVLPVARNLITRPTQNRSWPAETEAHRIGWKWLVATGCLVFPNEFKYGKQIRELNEPGSSPQAARIHDREAARGGRLSTRFAVNYYPGSNTF